MPPEIIVAIIAGCAGISGGIIAWIQSLKINRLNLTWEKTKAEQERRRKAFEVALIESKPIENGLAEAWKDIQIIKEVITKVLALGRCDLSLVLQEFNPAYSSLKEGYAKWGSDVPESARDAWHKAKSNANTIEMALTVPDADHVSVCTEVLQRLQEIRLSLTDCQMILALSRQTIRESVAQQMIRCL